MNLIVHQLYINYHNIYISMTLIFII